MRRSALLISLLLVLSGVASADVVVLLPPKTLIAMPDNTRTVLKASHFMLSREALDSVNVAMQENVKLRRALAACASQRQPASATASSTGWRWAFGLAAMGAAFVAGASLL